MGSLTVLLNAADWGGGHAALPPGQFPPQDASSLSERFPLGSSLGAFQVEALSVVQLPVTSRQEAVQSLAWSPATIPAPDAELTMLTRVLATVRYPQDALFALERDRLADGMTSSL